MEVRELRRALLNGRSTSPRREAEARCASVRTVAGRVKERRVHPWSGGSLRRMASEARPDLCAASRRLGTNALRTKSAGLSRPHATRRSPLQLNLTVTKLGHPDGWQGLGVIGRCHVPSEDHPCCPLQLPFLLLLLLRHAGRSARIDEHQAHAGRPIVRDPRHRAECAAIDHQPRATYRVARRRRLSLGRLTLSSASVALGRTPAVNCVSQTTLNELGGTLGLLICGPSGIWLTALLDRLASEPGRQAWITMTA